MPIAFTSSVSLLRGRVLLAPPTCTSLPIIFRARASSTCRTNPPSPSLPPYAALERSNAPPRGPVRGGVSVAFLSLAGRVSVLAAIALLPLPAAFTLLRAAPRPSPSSHALPIATSFMSFAYGLSISRFNLHLIRHLRLTLFTAIATRLTVVPLLTLVFALTSTIAFTPDPATMSSLMLLLTLSAPSLSPCVAALTPYIHPDLFAHLTLLSTLAFPTVLLTLAAPLPALLPTATNLFLSTAAPLLLALLVSHFLPPRLQSRLNLLALPLAWALSVYVLSSACASAALSSPLSLAACVALSASVAVSMAAIATTLGRGLRLDLRARRTLVLYFVTQGSCVGAGMGAAQAAVAALCVGAGACWGLGRFWSRARARGRVGIFGAEG